MVDSSTVQDSQKKAAKPPPCGRHFTASRHKLSLPRGLRKCFIHLCRQMLQMLQFLLGKSPQAPEGFLSRTNMANSHQQMTPPRKVFFKMCFIEKGSQILNPGIFLGCFGNQKDIPKSSLQNLIKGHLTLSTPPFPELQVLPWPLFPKPH